MASQPHSLTPHASRLPGLFITGTSTEVGKTHVAAMIARALVAAGRRVGVYKPVASGCRREGDELVADDAVAAVGSGGPARRARARLPAAVSRAAGAASGGARGRPARRRGAACARGSTTGGRRATSCSSKAPAGSCRR